MHMKCPYCEYYWCWMCGLPVDSFFHKGQGGGLICEVIGQSSFTDNRGSCARSLILLILFVFWPIVFLLFILQGALFGCLIIISNSKLIRMFTLDTTRVKRSLENCFRRIKLCFYITHLLFMLVYYPYLICFYILIFVIWISTSAILTLIWYTALIIPSYISFIVVVIRKQMVWNE